MQQQQQPEMRMSTDASAPEKASGPGYTVKGRSTMPLAKWLAIPDCPRQRDTRSRMGSSKHLDVFEPIHAEVSMVELPDGTLYKLDGHTRSAKWLKNPEMAPKDVRVTIYAVDNLDVIKRLYNRIDSKKTVETPRQQTTGLARFQGLDFQSRMMQSGCYTAGLKALHRYMEGGRDRRDDEKFTDAAIAAYRAELLLLDSLNATAVMFPAGLTMAALATLKVRGAPALSFWRRYADKDGLRAKGQMDAVQALLEVNLTARGPGTPKETLTQNLFNRGVTAFQGWERRILYTKGVKTMAPENLQAFCRGHLDQA